MLTLVYHGGALGDFLTTVPALRYGKNLHGRDRFVLLGRPAIGELAEDSGVIDEVLDVNSSRFLPLFSEGPAAAKILSPFRTVILFAAPGSPVIENVRRHSAAKLHWQPPFPSSRIHAIDYHLSLFADPSAVPGNEKIPCIRPSAHAMAAVSPVLPADISPVAIHPGSGSGKKNWPFDRFLSLAGFLREKGLRIMWLLGPAEERLDVPAQDILISNQPLALCAALLSRCRAFIGNDSGMAHLAAAVGCRTIALFGPSDPAVWAPRGRDVRVIYKQKTCSPCHRSPAAPVSCDTSCMTAITVDDVQRAMPEIK